MVSIKRGSIYLSRELCDAHLPDAGAVALLARDDAVLIVPLARQSAGGLLLKVRNALFGVTDVFGLFLFNLMLQIVKLLLRSDGHGDGVRAGRLGRV